MEVLEENERDIVNCGWSNYRMSEKTLIDLMERRIKGEKIVLPEGYEPWGFDSLSRISLNLEIIH